MEKTIYGYAGKLLRVNLTDRTWKSEEIPESVRNEYLGGRGFIAKYCYDEISSDIDPMSPENKIFFAVGPLTGTRYIASGRYIVGGYSPHSLSYTRSTCGGAWGAHLKWTGYDMLIVEGAAEEWTYLYITNDGVEFRDARPLLGMTTDETETAVIEATNKKAKAAVIGPSGEKLVTMACIQTERRSAGRGGCGCMMGSKKLKAIAIYGTEKPQIYDEERFNRRCKEAIIANRNAHWYDHFHPYGSMTGCDMTYNLNIYPIKNWQKTTDERMANMVKEGVIALGTKVKETGCYNCYMQCGSIHDIKDGPFKGEGYENPEYETMWSYGGNCMNFDPKAVIAANKICDDNGIDTMSSGTCVAFIMECYERGYITKEDLNGVEAVWGDGVAMCKIAEQIALRSSRMGDAAADGGVRHLAEVVGHDSYKFAMESRGLELAAYDPRGAKAHGVGYATSPIGGSHQTGYGMAEIFGMPEKVDRFTPYGKGKYTVWSQQFIMCCDTAVTCGFPTGLTVDALNLETVSDWYTMAAGPGYGWESKEEVLRTFDRIFNLETAINLRLGGRAAVNDLPDRLKEEPLPDGYGKGQVWEKDILLPEYYESRGWTQKGIPTRETLKKLDIEYVSDDLEERGYATT